MMGKLSGKVAVVTGGASGIGLGTAKLFVAEGARVVIVDLDQAALDAAVRVIGGDVVAFNCNVSRIADLKALRSHIENKHGRIDVLFANAGHVNPLPFDVVTESDFDMTVDTNLKGTFFTVQTLLPLMQSGGSIILNTSIQSAKAFTGFSVYAATKAAVRSLARTLTAELAPKGIRTNAVAPGYIATDLRRKVGWTEEMIRADDLRIAAAVPLKRGGHAVDVAKSVLFLASDEADYISGIELTVDGGVAQI
jgi:NAD(P)-dependent dehydrogenase (short-subunit alcohol dehydrogenase family)